MDFKEKRDLEQHLHTEIHFTTFKLHLMQVLTQLIKNVSIFNLYQKSNSKLMKKKNQIECVTIRFKNIQMTEKIIKINWKQKKD